MNRQLLEGLAEARQAKQPVTVLTELSGGRQALFRPDLDPPPEGYPAEVLEAASRALRDDRSATVEAAEERFFVHAFNPRLRLVVVGAVHIAQSLVPQANLLDYEVTVVDPRRAFASAERFPDVTVIAEWPDDALRELVPDTRTAIVTLTHDPKIDDPALDCALRSRAFYIGSLGSRRTHAARLERLRAQGFGEADLERIHGPIGLDLGARSTGEIATSVMAQITAVLRGRGQDRA